MIPVIQRGDGGRWSLTWDTGREVFELHLADDGSIDWWWRNRETNEVDGSDDYEAPFSPRFRARADAFNEHARGTR